MKMLPRWIFVSVAVALLSIRCPAGQITAPNSPTNALSMSPAAGAPATLAPPIASMLQLSGSMVLKVTSFSATRDELFDVARHEGAQVLDARTFVNPKGFKHGYVRLRVSTDRLSAFRTEVLPLGTLYSESVQSSDVSSDYGAMALRIQKLKEHEGRLEGILSSGRHMRGNDILFLQERLYKANTDEVDLIQQRGDLLRGSQISTFSVALFEPGTMPEAGKTRHSPGAWFAASLAIARDGFGRQMDRAATAAAYTMVWAPVWIPIALVAMIVLWLLWRIRMRIAAWLVRSVVAAFGVMQSGVTVAKKLELNLARRRDKPAG